MSCKEGIHVYHHWTKFIMVTEPDPKEGERLTRSTGVLPLLLYTEEHDER